MNVKSYLTSNGNILRVPESGWISFHKPDGAFLRLATVEETDYLVDVMPRIDFIENAPDWEQVKLWQYLWSVYDDDKTNYDPDRSSNGGKYRFGCEAMFFARKTNNGNWEFCRLNVHSTSADFDFCELTGSFTNTYCTDVLGADIQLSFWTADYSDSVLDQVAHRLEGVPFNVGNSDWYKDGDTVEYEEYEPSFGEKRRRVERLREIGYVRPNPKQRAVLANLKSKRRR